MALEGMRNYDAGGLVGRAGVTRAMQLEHPANFEDGKGRLFLVRCVACGEPPRGRENWLPMAADGACAWCGWTEGQLPQE